MEKYELEIKNLNLSIGNNSILENINLKIKKGEIHCLIGPNGGGKSSLIKCILKELNFQGDITFQNNHKNIIGYLPQQYRHVIHGYTNLKLKNKNINISAIGN